MANMLRGLLEKLRGPQEDSRDIWGYSDMLDMSTPLWSGIEDYDQWREAMLQNKQPFGQVPIAVNESGEEVPWDTPGARPSNRFDVGNVFPEQAGMEGLFAENPELNYLNPSNKMFPWQPDYSAIYQADRMMKQNMLGEQEIGKRMGVFDASEFYAKREAETGKGSPLGTNWRGGTSSVNLDLIEDQDQLYYDVLPHELGWHNWEEDPEIRDIVPYWHSAGYNPNTGKKEDYTKSGDFWGHDLAYAAEPHYWKDSPFATDYSSPYSYGNPGNRFNRVDWTGEPLKGYSLSDESSMNLIALHNLSKKRLGYGTGEYVPPTKETQSYVPSRASQYTKESYTDPWRSQEYNVGSERAGPARGIIKTDNRPTGTERFNTGGLASLWQT